MPGQLSRSRANVTIPQALTVLEDTEGFCYTDIKHCMQNFLPIESPTVESDLP